MEEGCGLLITFQALSYFYDENANLFIGDTYYMTYHTTCITSEEFYTALIRARALSQDINDMFKKHDLDVQVFPYRYEVLKVYVSIVGQLKGNFDCSTHF